ncbi:MAG: TRAP transporter TatT component family protein [Limisphaerales bacterium]
MNVTSAILDPPEDQRGSRAIASRRAARGFARVIGPRGLLLLLIASMAGGCSVRKFAINQVGDALAGGGTTFASDDDPELVRQAVPFSLKLMESLLAETPEHQGLLFASASGFTQYAYAFVQQEADELEDEDVAAAATMRDRARRLHLRARNYGLRGLEASHPGFQEKLRADAAAAVALARRRDVPLLYWTAASWASAISLSKNNPDLIADLPQVEAMIDRALELDEAWDRGAIHSLLITYETVRQGAAGEGADRARRHFERAVELSGGRNAGPYVALAEAVAVQAQDVKEFDALLAQALAINADATPDQRLVNLVMQRRARWLLARRENLFLLPNDSN